MRVCVGVGVRVRVGVGVGVGVRVGVRVRVQVGSGWGSRLGSGCVGSGEGGCMHACWLPWFAVFISRLLTFFAPEQA